MKALWSELFINKKLLKDKEMEIMKIQEEQTLNGEIRAQ